MSHGWRRDIAVLLLIAVLCLPRASCGAVRQVHPRVMWRVAEGEYGAHVSFLSSGGVGVVTWSDDASEFYVRALDAHGRVLRRVTLPANTQMASLAGGTGDSDVLSLSCRESDGVWFPLLVDLSTGKMTRLTEGYTFPVGVYGNNTPLCSSKCLALIVPAGKDSGMPWIVDAASGARLRQVTALPTYHGALIRWTGKCSLIWLDPARWTLGGESPGPTDSTAARRLQHLKRGNTVLSPDGRKVVTYEMLNARKVRISVRDAGNGRLLWPFIFHISASEYIESMKWSPDGKKIAAGIMDKQMQCGSALCIASESGSMYRVAMAGWRFPGLESNYSWASDSKRLALALVSDTGADDHVVVGIVNVP